MIRWWNAGGPPVARFDITNSGLYLEMVMCYRRSWRALKGESEGLQITTWTHVVIISLDVVLLWLHLISEI